MPDWRDNLYEGTWKGIPFFLDGEVRSTIGRRTITNVYPGNQSKPHVEDMGPAPRRFTLNMLVIGKNYDVDRDEFLGSFAEGGQGELVHPFWGPMQCTVEGEVTCTESTKRGGTAIFSVTFVQDGADLDLLSPVATEVAIEEVTEKIIVIAESEFAELFSVAEGIASTIDAAVQAVQTVATAINQVRGKIAAALQVIDSAAQAITSVADAVVSLIQTPQLLAAQLTNVVRQVVDGVTSIDAAYNAAIDFFDGEDALPSEGNVIAARSRVTALLDAAVGFLAVPLALPAIIAGTAQQQAIKAQNQKVLARLVRANSVCVLSQVAVDLQFESFDQAQQMRVALTDLIDALVDDDELSDSLYAPLCELRASLAAHFSQAANTLPELQDYVPIQSTPAIVVAYRVYGDSKREAELLARNPQLRDPSAVPGGQVIQVLTDD